MTIVTDMTKVLRFINNFKERNPKELEDSFLHGNCYWFAKNLADRFNGIIYYDPIENHFFTKIDNYYYDIRGLISPKADKIYPWEGYKIIESLNAQRIEKNCILKEE